MTPPTPIQTQQLCPRCDAVVKVNRYGRFRLHFTGRSGRHCHTSGRLPEEVRS